MMSSGLVKVAQTAKQTGSQITAVFNKVQESIDKATVKTNYFANGLEKVREKIRGLSVRGVLGSIGIATGMFAVGQMVHSGIEKAHMRHEAEAGLANTMQNMGNYSEEGFEKAIKGAKELASKVNFSSTEFIQLQSQIRLVGSVGEKEMARMSKSAADMASKFGMGLLESGEMIAKSVNNPEMLRLLARKLKIGLGTQQHLQGLAKSGHESQARSELLDIIENKIGGDAEAKFNANPLAKYTKRVGEMQIALGNAAIEIQATLAPALEWLASQFVKVANFIKDAVHWLKEHKKFTEILAVAVGAFTLILMAHSIWTWAVVAANTVLTVTLNGLALACDLVAGAFELLNVTNPLAWIIALIATIGYLSYAFDGWAKGWGFLMDYLSISWDAFKNYFNTTWLEVKDGFLSGIEAMQRAWYKFQSLWDKEGASAGLAGLNEKAKQRAEEITASKKISVELEKKAKESWDNIISKNGIHSNGKGFGTVVGDIKKSIGLNGIAGNSKENLVNKNNKGDGSDYSGDPEGSTAKGITGGGPRVININGLHMKLAEKIEVMATNGKDFLEKLEPEMENFFLRVLNSGASVQ